MQLKWDYPRRRLYELAYQLNSCQKEQVFVIDNKTGEIHQRRRKTRPFYLPIKSLNKRRTGT